jgi:hypothetical protein
LAKIQNIANNSLTVSEMEGIKENVFFALPKKVRKANDQ